MIGIKLSKGPTNHRFAIRGGSNAKASAFNSYIPSITSNPFQRLYFGPTDLVSHASLQCLEQGGLAVEAAADDQRHPLADTHTPHHALVGEGGLYLKGGRRLEGHSFCFGVGFV